MEKSGIVKEKFAEYLQAEFETGFEDEEMSWSPTKSFKSFYNKFK